MADRCRGDGGWGGCACVIMAVWLFFWGGCGLASDIRKAQESLDRIETMLAKDHPSEE
jgi:hypothetical protein